MVWKKNFYAIWIAQFLAIAGFNTSIPIIPFYLQDLGVTDPLLLKMWVGLCQGGSAISMIFFAPIWGKISDLYGRKPMLLRAMFGGALVMALQGFTTAPYHIFILRIFQGTLSGTVAAATVLVATTVPKEKAGYYLGLLQMAIFLGSSTGPLIGGVISDFWGNRMAFFTTSTLMFSGGIIILIFVKEDFHRVPQKITLFKAIVPDFSPLRESRELLILLLITGLVYIANSSAAPIVPLFVQSMSPEGALVGSTSGAVIGAAALASALAAGLIGRVSFRIGYRRTLLFCLAGAGCFLIPQGLSTSPLMLLIFRALGGVFFGGTMPSINAMIVIRADSNKQGSIYGLNSSMGSGGSALGPLIGASTAALWGFPAAFFASSLALFTGFLVVLILTKKVQDPADCPA